MGSTPPILPATQLLFHALQELVPGTGDRHRAAATIYRILNSLSRKAGKVCKNEVDNEFTLVPLLAHYKGSVVAFTVLLKNGIPTHASRFFAFSKPDFGLNLGGPLQSCSMVAILFMSF